MTEEQVLSKVEVLRVNADAATIRKVPRIGGFPVQRRPSPAGKGHRPECRAALTLQDGTALLTTLLSLSRTEFRLDGVPSDWQVGQSVRFYLGIGEAQVLMGGRVDQRRGDTVRIRFADSGPEHESKVQWLLRELLAAWKTAA